MRLELFFNSTVSFECYFPARTIFTHCTVHYNTILVMIAAQSGTIALHCGFPEISCFRRFTMIHNSLIPLVLQVAGNAVRFCLPLLLQVTILSLKITAPHPCHNFESSPCLSTPLLFLLLSSDYLLQDRSTI